LLIPYLSGFISFELGLLFFWLVLDLQHGHHSNPAAQNFQHTANQEENDQYDNSTAQSQAPDDGYINVRNMLSK